MAEHLVIGTAGHIDHGKTSLIRALTGVDLDRLPEERERGITIALGFTHLELPSGRIASFIDVPGHERLVRTMVAGASGIDAVLLCVSAVEGVMPQTHEHVAIVDLLGVRHGVIALTMADLLEGAPSGEAAGEKIDQEMLELARMDVEEAVAGTFLEGAPIVVTSAGPVPRGLDELITALDALPVVERPEGGPLRLPIDRAFVRRGFGTVVTGTLRSGRLRDGEEVEVLPAGLRARVRGIEVHGQAVTESRPGLRTAVNLAGVERHDLARGMVVVHPGQVQVSSILDVRYRHLPAAPRLEQGVRVRLLAGTAEVMAVATPLDAEALIPGASSLLQLRTEAPVVALPGDRFVLRRESPLETLGGGTVLDPWAPRARRRDRARAVRELWALEAGDRTVLLQRAGHAGLTLDEARMRGVSTVGRRLGDRCFHPDRVAAWEEELLEALAAFHRANPLVPGAPRRELQGSVVGRAFDDLVAGLARQGRVVLDGPRLRLPHFRIELHAAQQQALDALERRVRSGHLEGVKASELLAAAPEYVHLLVRAGRAVRVGERLVHRDVLGELTEQVRSFLAEHGEISPTDFKQLTGLSRRYAIPLLEWLDDNGVTRRQGNTRVAR